MLKKAICAVSILIVSLPYYAQEEKKATYGFTVGVNRSITEHNLQKITKDDNGIGFRLGIAADFQLIRGLYFTPRAELSFYDNALEYGQFGELDEGEYLIIPTGLETKVNFAYKFREGKDVRPFLMGGASYIASLSRELETFEYASGSTITADVGIGVERKFDNFIFAPEFRYSHGLSNVNQNPWFSGDVFMHNFAVVLVLKG